MTRRRPSHATIVSVLALVVALATGSAWAVARIGAADIQDDAVLSRHIRDGDVRAADVATISNGNPNALSGADFADGSLTGADIDETFLFNVAFLTGADIDESSLGTVPSATSADSATSANALQLHPASDFATDRASFRTALPRMLAVKNPGDIASGFNLGQLALRVECNSGPDIAVLASTRVDNAMIRSGSINLNGDATTNYVENDDFDVGEQVDLVPGAVSGQTQADDSVQGTFEYFNTSGSESVTASFLAEETTTRCILAGMPASATFSP